MERVLIIGSSGSGKSTLAKALGTKTGLPVIHLDRHYWRPAWVEPDSETWALTVGDLVQRPRWIIDGNYGNSLPTRVAAADAVLFLDFPRWLCIRRVLLRSARWIGRTRDDMGPGCAERLDWEFLKYIWRWPLDSRPRAMAALEGFQGQLVVLRRQRDVAKFLRKVSGRALAAC